MSMVLAIFILVVFQVLVTFNRSHLSLTTNNKRKDEEMKGGTANEGPDPLSVNSKSRIAWEILHRIFGAALMA